MKRRIIETGDGSKTVYIEEMDENYHSNHGAFQEAMHVFIQNGIRLTEQQDLTIFEMGFGTGLNALLALVEANNDNRKIYYKGIEAYPVEMEMIQEIGYEKFVKESFHSSFFKMHSVEWNTKHIFSDNFSFQKINEKIENHQIDENSCDIVFFDAFGPRAQSAMWEKSILNKMYLLLKPSGFLVTYCAKGQVKRDLKSLGFEVKSVPGPPGKREMTIAYKSEK